MIVVIKGRCFGDDLSPDDEEQHVENVQCVVYDKYGLRMCFDHSEDIRIDMCDNRTVSVVDSR